MHLGLSTLNNSIFQCLQHSNVSGGERLLPLPEDLRVRFQSPATFIEQLFTVCRKDENKDKEASNGPFKKPCHDHSEKRMHQTAKLDAKIERVNRSFLSELRALALPNPSLLFLTEILLLLSLGIKPDVKCLDHSASFPASFSCAFGCWPILCDLAKGRIGGVTQSKVTTTLKLFSAGVEGYTNRFDWFFSLPRYTCLNKLIISHLSQRLNKRICWKEWVEKLPNWPKD